MSGKAEATCEKHRLSQPSTWCVADVWCGVALGSHQRPSLPRPPPRGFVAYKTEPEGPLRSPLDCPKQVASSLGPSSLKASILCQHLQESWRPTPAAPARGRWHPAHTEGRPELARMEERTWRLSACPVSASLPGMVDRGCLLPPGWPGVGPRCPWLWVLPGVPASACYGGGTQPGRSLTPATQEPGPGLRAHATGYLLRTRHGQSLL